VFCLAKSGEVDGAWMSRLFAKVMACLSCGLNRAREMAPRIVAKSGAPASTSLVKGGWSSGVASGGAVTCAVGVTASDGWADGGCGSAAVVGDARGAKSGTDLGKGAWGPPPGGSRDRCDGRADSSSKGVVMPWFVLWPTRAAKGECVLRYF